MLFEFRIILYDLYGAVFAEINNRGVAARKEKLASKERAFANIYPHRSRSSTKRQYPLQIIDRKTYEQDGGQLRISAYTEQPSNPARARSHHQQTASPRQALYNITTSDARVYAKQSVLGGGIIYVLIYSKIEKYEVRPPETISFAKTPHCARSVV